MEDEEAACKLREHIKWKLNINNNLKIKRWLAF